MARARAKTKRTTTARKSQGRGVESRLAAQRPKRSAKQRRQTRQTAAKAARRVGAVLGHLAVVLVVSAALLAGWSLLSAGRAFAVRQTEIDGLERVCRLDVLRAAGIGAHSNVLDMRTEPLRQRIEALPWVKRVEIDRVPPHTVRISVVEYQPAALAVAGGQVLCLDAEMRPFAQLGPEDDLDLPLISGLEKADLVEPDEEIRALLDDAAAVLAILPLAGVPGRRALSEIHLDRITGLSLVFDGLAPTVRLGFADFGPRLRTLVRVMADLEARHELHRATLIDLDHQDRAIVRLARGKA